MSEYGLAFHASSRPRPGDNAFNHGDTRLRLPAATSDDTVPGLVMCGPGIARSDFVDPFDQP